MIKAAKNVKRLFIILGFKDSNLCILVILQKGMVKNSSKQLGLEGEKQSREFLQNKGYTILEQNWRFKKYEVDLIARKDDLIVFIEVKTRKNNTFGEPEVFVTRKKQSFLIAAANQYLIERNIDLSSRFDVVSLVGTGSELSVNHLEGAFHPNIHK
jgi:putative endonuclease